MRVTSEIKLEVKGPVISDVISFKREIVIDEKEIISNKGKRRVKLDVAGGSPFPDFKRPSYEDCRQVVDSLSALHGVKEVQNSVRPVLDALIRTILSQNTTDKTSMIAFQNLKRVCPTWKSCLASHDSVIEEAIRFGGLAEIKTKRIKVILKDILDRHSEYCVGQEPSLEWMRALSTADVKAELGAYNGVGPKTISCVLMFAMERAEFPVDTHVWHITKKLGWVPSTCSRESCYEHLNNRVPDEFKFALHVLLVDHGKVCKACSKGGGRKSGDKEYEGGTNCCPLRRLGNQPSPSLENIGLDPRSLLSSYHDRADSIDKIKREYHIKEEWGQDNDHYKDIAIKAEPGHHDKISLGLFPSDVKSSFLMSTVKIEHEEELKIEKTLTVVTPAADTVYASLRAEKILIVKEEKLFSETAVPRRSERRGYSASKEVKVELKKRNNMDDQDNETSCMKRKGAILRQIQS